jgi:hypothetical protein
MGKMALDRRSCFSLVFSHCFDQASQVLSAAGTGNHYFY